MLTYIIDRPTGMTLLLKARSGICDSNTLISKVSSFLGHISNLFRNKLLFYTIALKETDNYTRTMFHQKCAKLVREIVISEWKQELARNLKRILKFKFLKN